ncbi:F-box and leucine-rich repeat protein 13-like isoform X2 [Lineus longissimus]|uniref:F-box and leucine-rich repeat protein 13-like isoform X2 n=1 Tax=Lineus longissimus TaxID=88925 RepID=UPI002B4D5A2A
MAASLKGLDPALKIYLRNNRLPDVYEALLTSVAVMCPDDPLQFIIDKLSVIRDQGYGILEWDVFIDEGMKPKSKIINESNLEYIFNFDENALPTPEMYAKAYGHYNNKLKTMCYSSWMQYHLRKQAKQRALQAKMDRAATHYAHRKMRIHIHIWMEWVRFRKGRQAMAFNKIQHVFHVSVGRVIFEAWHNVTLDAKKTREYFEVKLSRLERGENMDDDDEFSRGGGEARDDISMLPRKVAIKIFGYISIADLARCASVCRSWKVITQSSALWSMLDLSQVKDRIKDRPACRLLAKCRPFLVHLNMRGCDMLSKPTFVSMSECRNLQDLNLSECPGVTDETIRIVADGCSILLYLNLSHTDITDASLRTLAKRCPNLQYISLAFCRKFTDRGLAYISHSEGAKKLLYLDMSACLQITEKGFKFIADGCRNIQFLMLNEFTSLSDEAVQVLADNCKNLRHISFLGSPFLSDETFKKFAVHKKLEKIKIEGNQKLSDAGLKPIGKFCHELRHLYMVDCQRITDLSLKALSLCRHLTVLNLADCVRITDTGVRYIVEGSCGPKLRELNLTNCIRLGDIGLVNIHKRCHSLAYLSVCFCEHISEAGIELLGQTHSLTSLDISGCNCGDQGLSALGNNQHFNDVCLSECSAVTDLGLQKFAQQCKEVERLDLSHCQQLTDGAIKNLAFCCRILSVLNLAGCKLLTDLSIQYLSGVCHYLRSLDLSGCILVSDKSMKYLRKGCKNLKTLIILYCCNISKHTAAKMARQLEVQYSQDEVPSYFGY